ncbi:hypothetical protein CP061683_0047A, partial [Chlamydia psittaci 06-1683]
MRMLLADLLLTL